MKYLMYTKLLLVFLLVSCGDYTKPAKTNSKSISQAAQQPSKKNQEWKCPLDVLPGKGIGPIQTGLTRSDVLQIGQQVDNSDSDIKRTVWANGEFDVFFGESDKNKVIGVQAWLDKAPDACLRYKNKSFSRKGDIGAIIEQFKDCHNIPTSLIEKKLSMGKCHKVGDEEICSVDKYRQYLEEKRKTQKGQAKIRSGGTDIVCENGEVTIVLRTISDPNKDFAVGFLVGKRSEKL